MTMLILILSVKTLSNSSEEFLFMQSANLGKIAVDIAIDNIDNGSKKTDPGREKPDNADRYRGEICGTDNSQAQTRGTVVPGRVQDDGSDLRKRGLHLGTRLE